LIKIPRLAKSWHLDVFRRLNWTKPLSLLLPREKPEFFFVFAQNISRVFTQGLLEENAGEGGLATYICGDEARLRGFRRKPISNAGF